MVATVTYYMIEKYIDESVGAMVKIMVRGGCLPLKGNTRMLWKCDHEHCVCGGIRGACVVRM